MNQRRYELSDAQWQMIAPHLPSERSGPGKRGRPRADARKVVNGMVWILRSGAAWRDLPARYGPFATVYTRFREMVQQGTMEKIARSLQLESHLKEALEDEHWQMDSSTARAHVSAAGAPKKKPDSR